MYSFFPNYSNWRDFKLAHLMTKPSVLHLQSLSQLSQHSLSQISASLDQRNFIIYDVSEAPHDFESDVPSFAHQLGLEALDKHLCVAEDQVTKIFDQVDQKNAFYIPYTSKPINWHTDGYYNLQNKKVHAFLLHCAHPAFEGGVNSLLDQDQVFIHLMSQNPRYIEALMQNDVMTIPENRKEGILIRPQTSTAIFEVLNAQHHVLMRYSMRKKNIVFKDDDLTQEALACMDEFINSASSPYISIKLKAGQGVICNNVLHKRTSFKDKVGQERLYYRARFYNRVTIK